MLARTARPLALVAPLSPSGPAALVGPRQVRGAGREVRRISGREIRTASPSPACPQAGFVCTHDARCLCPSPSHVTDAERAVMAGMTRQAARLASVLAWVFALVALTALVLLMRA